MSFLVFIGIVLSAIFIFDRVTRKYVQIYTMTMFIGKKGSGKSTMLVKEMLKHRDKGWTIFVTDKAIQVEGTTYIPYLKVFEYDFPRDSLLVIDEIALHASNRAFKDFTPKMREFFAYSRHRGIKIISATQNYTLVDKYIREQTDFVYIMNRMFRVFVRARYVGKRLTCTEATGDNPSTIVEQLYFIALLAGGRKYAFIPKIAKLYDSYSDFSSTKEDDKGAVARASTPEKS